MVDDRGDDGKHDAFLDPKDHHRYGREQGNGELEAPAGQDAPHPGDVDEPGGDEEDDRRQAAMGRLASGPVSSSRTRSTAALVVSWVSWLRPPALSATCVWVGLPFTTKAPESAATTLAAPRPTRSVSWLNASSYFPAYAREVAALWARMTTNIDAAVPMSAPRHASRAQAAPGVAARAGRVPAQPRRARPDPLPGSHRSRRSPRSAGLGSCGRPSGSQHDHDDSCRHRHVCPVHLRQRPHDVQELGWRALAVAVTPSMSGSCPAPPGYRRR